MPWPVYLALKQLFPTGRVSFFTVIATIGITLGVTIMLMVTSIMGGFGYQAGRMIIDTQGEIQIRARAPIGPPVTNAVATALSQSPEVVAFAPQASGVVMLEYRDRPVFPTIQGFDYEQMKKVIPLDRYLVAGSLDDLDDDSVILSSILARSLGAGVGDKVSLYTPLMMERLRKNEVLLPREVRVAGIFQIGHQQLDSSTVICSLRLMQDLYGLGAGVHGVTVRLAPGVDADEFAAQLNGLFDGADRAISWLESSRDFLFVLQLEKNVLMFIILFIILVASFSIASSLLTSVVRKTKEIGLLSALGGKPRQVAACFCFQGFFIGVAGTALGIGFAVLALSFRNEIVHVFARLTQSEAALLRFYQFANLPLSYSAHDLTVIVVSSIVIATLAGTLPAWRAARLQPVEALRSE